jgi:hypothetical protein
MALTVSRNASPNLDPAQPRDPANDLLRANQFAAARTTVRGQEALLWTQPAHTMLNPGPPAYRLIWRDPSGVTIEIDAFGGPTRGDIQHVADALVIGASERADTAVRQDVAAIRETFSQAYDAPKAAAQALAAVQDGSTVASTLQQLTKALPQSVNTSRVSVGDIRFIGSDEAIVDANVVAAWMGSSVSKDFPRRAVRINGEWKVSRESFCASISAPGISCQPLAAKTPTAR